jgi:hypothetical protein
MKFMPYISCLLLFILGLTFSQESASNDVTRNLSPEMREAMKQLFPWLEDAQSVQMGPYQIFRPNDPKNADIWVVGPDPSKAVSINSNRVTVVVDIGGIGIDDRNDDGVYEVINYETIDSSGKVTGTVYDWDRDGVLDFKTVFSGDPSIPPEAYVNLSGNWHLLIHKDGRAWVNIENEIVEVKKVGNKFVPVQQGNP